MEINQYLYELLFEHEKVVIPGLGAIIAKPIPASIHPAENKMTPPSKELSFDEKQSTDDGLLLNFIQKKTFGKPEEIKKELDEFVARTKKELKEGKRIQLPGIGFLFTDIEGKIKLDADKSSNFLKSSFGLEAVVSPAIQRRPVSEPQKVVVKEKKKQKGLVWIPIAALLVIAIGAGIWKADQLKAYYQKITKKEVAVIDKPVDTTREAQVVKQVEQETIPEDTATVDSMIIDEGTASMPTEEDIAEIEPVEEENPVNKSEPAATQGNGDYYIITGCFRSLEKAEDQVAKINSEGYNAYIKGTTNSGLHRVVIGGFPTWNGANKELHNYREAGDNSAWILKIKE